MPQEGSRDAIKNDMEAILQRRFSENGDRRHFNRQFSRLHRTSPHEACELLLRAVDILLLSGADNIDVELEVVKDIMPEHSKQLACVLDGLSKDKWEACRHKKCLEIIVNQPRHTGNLVKVVLKQFSRNIKGVLKILSEARCQSPALFDAYSALAQKYPEYHTVISNAATMFAQKYNEPRMWSLALSLETRLDALVDKCRRLWLADGDIETLAATVQFDRLLGAPGLPQLAGTLLRRPHRIHSLAMAVATKPFGAQVLLTLLAMIPNPKWVSELECLRPFLSGQCPEDQRKWQILWHAATGKCMSIENIHELLSHAGEDLELQSILGLCSPCAEVVWDCCQKNIDVEIKRLQGIYGCPQRTDVTTWQEELKTRVRDNSNIYDKLTAEQEAAELAISQGQVFSALQILGTLLASLSTTKGVDGLTMDVLHRSSQLLLFFGSIDDAWSCIKKGMGRARALELAGRQAIFRSDYNYLAKLVGAEEDNGTELPSPWTPLPHLGELPAIRSQHHAALQRLSEDPRYALLNEAALANFGTTSLPVRARRCVQYLEEIYHQLINLGHKGDFTEKNERAQLLGISSAILSTVANAGDQAPMNEREENRFAGLGASRHFLHGDLVANSKGPLPEHLVVVAIDIDVNESCLVLTRFEPFQQPFSIRIPTARMRSLLSLDQEIDPELKIKGGLEDLQEIIEKSVSDAYRLQSDNSEFWKNQRDWDDEARRLVFRMQLHWLGGFRALLEPTTIKASPDTCNMIQQVLTDYLPHKVQINLPQSVLNLFARLGHPTEAEIEDLVWYILDTLQLQGQPLGYDDVDIDALVIKIHAILSHGQEPTRTHHLLLVVDSLASQVPWECFPCLRDIPASRQLNLDLIHRGPYSDSLGTEVRYVLNPGDNLHHLGENFSAAEFRLRGWSGIANLAPSPSELTSALEEGSCLVYMGHGAGTSYIQRSSLRALKKCCPVLLFGCGSAKLRNHAHYDASGPLTDYLIAGSPLVMGNLWTVKDKDMNRLAKEFVSRVFDYGEDPCRALMNCRRACLLHYLTGAAPVIYGYPPGPARAIM